MKNPHFPSTSIEGMGRWVGIAKHQGDVLTYQILTDDTSKVITRSMVRPFDPQNPNYRVLKSNDSGEDSDNDSSNEENISEIVKTYSDYITPENDPHTTRLPKFSPEKLIGLTFLHELSDGQKFRAEIVIKIQDMDTDNH